jgi:hypothetical protein
MREATPPPGLDHNAPRQTRKNPVTTAKVQASGNKLNSLPRARTDVVAEAALAGMPTPIPTKSLIEAAAAAEVASEGKEEVPSKKRGGKRKTAYVSSEEEEEERYRELGVEEIIETDLDGNERSRRAVKPATKTAKPPAKKKKTVFASTEEEEEERYRSMGVVEIIEADEEGNEKSRRSVKPSDEKKRADKAKLGE